MKARPLFLTLVACASTVISATGPALAAGQTLNPPPRLGSLASAKVTNAEWGKKFASRDARQAALIRQRVSRAYHGASSAAQIYRGTDLKDGALLIAVTGTSPGLFVTDEPAAELALAKPVHDVISVGPVQCLVSNSPRAAGSPAVADETSVVRCQRTATGFTVLVDPLYGGPLAHDPKAVAALVNQAWDAMRPR